MIQRVFTRIAQLEPAPPWGMLSAVATVIAMFAAMVIGTTIAVTLLVGQDAASSVALTLTQRPDVLPVGWIIGSILTVAFVWSGRRRDADRSALRLNVSALPLPFLLLLGVGFAILLDLISLAVTGQFLPTPELHYVAFGDATIGAWTAAVLLLVLAQPITEELVFRGILFPALRAATGAWAGLFLTALLYGTFHLLTYTPPQEGLVGVWYGLLAPLLAGLVIGGVRAYTGSTRAAIIMHVGFGIFAILKALTISG